MEQARTDRFHRSPCLTCLPVLPRFLVRPALLTRS